MCRKFSDIRDAQISKHAAVIARIPTKTPMGSIHALILHSQICITLVSRDLSKRFFNEIIFSCIFSVKRTFPK